MDFGSLFMGRVSLILVGNELNADDSMGYLLYKMLEGRMDDCCQLLYASTVPENFIGEVVDFAPEKAIVIDVAEFDAIPGEIRLLDPTKLGGFNLSTHNMPMQYFRRMLSQHGIQTHFLAVKGGNYGVAEQISEEVEKSAKKIADSVIKSRI